MLTLGKVRCRPIWMEGRKEVSRRVGGVLERAVATLLLRTRRFRNLPMFDYALFEELETNLRSVRSPHTPAVDNVMAPQDHTRSRARATYSEEGG